MASLKHHFQLAMLPLDQSLCCHICFMGTDWFLSTKWSFSETWSGRYQRKLTGSRFKTSHRKSCRASCSKMWPIWNVCMVSWGDCAISWQTNALKISKSVESAPGLEVLCHLWLEFGRAFGGGIILDTFVSFSFWLLAETWHWLIQTFGLIQYGVS